VATSLFSRAAAQHALLRCHLRSQRERLLQTWRQALALADNHASDHGELHRQLPELLDQVIAACLAEPFNPVFARRSARRWPSYAYHGRKRSAQPKRC
jgi:hypothetical protein